MPRTPARFTQADVARIVRAARQAGAREVDFKLADGVTATVKLTGPVDNQEAALAPAKEIVL